MKVDLLQDGNTFCLHACVCVCGSMWVSGGGRQFSAQNFTWLVSDRVKEAIRFLNTRVIQHAEKTVFTIIHNTQ